MTTIDHDATLFLQEGEVAPLVLKVALLQHLALRVLTSRPEHQLANGGTLEGGQVLAFEVSEQVGGRVNHGAFEILHR